jgi:hypothetical protein
VPNRPVNRCVPHVEPGPKDEKRDTEAASSRTRAQSLKFNGREHLKGGSITESLTCGCNDELASGKLVPQGLDKSLDPCGGGPGIDGIEVLNTERSEAVVI